MEHEHLKLRPLSTSVIAIGGMPLMAAMDGSVVVFALPKIQNELGLSDARRSWVITVGVLTFGGLILLGGRLGDTIGRKRTFIVGVALFTMRATDPLTGRSGTQYVLTLSRLTNMPWPVRSLVNRVPSAVALIVQPCAL